MICTEWYLHSDINEDMDIMVSPVTDVGEWDGELRGSRLEACLKSHKSEVAIT